MDDARFAFDLGFAPDADPQRPGVVVDCYNMIPCDRGMRTLGGVYPPNRTDTSDSATFTAEFILGHESFDITGYGIADEYVGTTTKVFRRLGSTGVYTDVSRTAGYSATFGTCWSFERFGNYVVGAVTTNDAVADVIGSAPLQAGTFSGGQLTDIPGAPTCGIITSAERFVLAFNGQAGAKDSWACSARDNHASWTASPSTLANSGRLVDPPGPIVAAKPLGNDVVVYKPDAIIVGSFVQGDPEVWKWQRTRHRVGALGPRAVCVLDDGRHAFIGAESCYLFDGSNVIDVLDGRARRWYKANRGVTYKVHQFAAHYDTANKLVWFTFTVASGGSGLPVIVYDPRSGKLGHCVLPAEMGCIANDPYETGSKTFAYFDDTEKRRWVFSSEFFDRVPPVLTHPGWLEGSYGNPYIVSHDMGHPFNFTDVNELHLDMPLTAGSDSISVELQSRDSRSPGAAVTTTFGTANNGSPSMFERFNARKTAHWHRVKVAFGRFAEISGVYASGSGFGGRRR